MIRWSPPDSDLRVMVPSPPSGSCAHALGPTGLQKSCKGLVPIGLPSSKNATEPVGLVQPNPLTAHEVLLSNTRARIVIASPYVTSGLGGGVSHGPLQSNKFRNRT